MSATYKHLHKTLHKTLYKGEEILEFSNLLKYGTAETFFSFLEQHGIDVNITYRQYQVHCIVNFLYEAVSENNTEIVKILLEKGVDPDILSYENNTPLFGFFGHYNIEIFKLLMDKGANINHKNSRGETPIFHISCYNHHSKEERQNIENFFNIFVGGGANIDEQNNLGNTILINAAASIRYDFCFFLLEKGINPYITNKRGFTFLHYIKSKKKKKEFEDYIEENYTSNMKPAKRN